MELLTSDHRLHLGRQHSATDLATTGQATVCYPWLDAGDLNYTPGGSETTVIRYSSKQNSRDIGLPMRGIKATTVAA